MNVLIYFLVAIGFLFIACALTVIAFAMLIGKVKLRPPNRHQVIYENYLAQRLFESEQARMRTEGQLLEKCEEVLSLQFEKVENERLNLIVDAAMEGYGDRSIPPQQPDTIEAEEFW